LCLCYEKLTLISPFDSSLVEEMEVAGRTFSLLTGGKGVQVPDASSNEPWKGCVTSLSLEVAEVPALNSDGTDSCHCQIGVEVQASYSNATLLGEAKTPHDSLIRAKVSTLHLMFAVLVAVVFFCDVCLE
jgi:hypothetical protein